jgi:hypothetical protein
MMRKFFSSFDGHGSYIDVAWLIEFCKLSFASEGRLLASRRESSTLGSVVASTAAAINC